jgi:hypothetical protein
MDKPTTTKSIGFVAACLVAAITASAYAAPTSGNLTRNFRGPFYQFAYPAQARLNQDEASVDLELPYGRFRFDAAQISVGQVSRMGGLGAALRAYVDSVMGPNNAIRENIGVSTFQGRPVTVYTRTLRVKRGGILTIQAKALDQFIPTNQAIYYVAMAAFPQELAQASSTWESMLSTLRLDPPPPPSPVPDPEPAPTPASPAYPSIDFDALLRELQRVSASASAAASNSLVGTWRYESASLSHYQEIVLDLHPNGTYDKRFRARSSQYMSIGGIGHTGTGPTMGGDHSGTWTANGSIVRLSGDGNWPPVTHDLSQFTRQ